MTQKPNVFPRTDRLSIGMVMLLVAGWRSGSGWWAKTSRSYSPVALTESPGGDSAGLTRGWRSLRARFSAASRSSDVLSCSGRRRRPWGAGRFLWFTYGTAAWLLWAPVVYLKAIDDNRSHRHRADEQIVLALPAVTSLFTMPALVASGALRRSRRRRLFRSWQELFGLILGSGWTCTGLYLIAWFYS